MHQEELDEVDARVLVQSTFYGTRKGSKDQTRTFDDDGFRRRAGCICFRDAAETEVLLVSSNGSPSRYVVPAGGVDPGEKPSTCAQREAIEEAGVEGRLARFVGIYQFDERRNRTAIFVMHVDKELPVEDWPDGKQAFRRRVWFSLQDAYRELSFKSRQQEFLLDAIASGPQRSQLGQNGLPSLDSDRQSHRVDRNGFKC